MLPARSSQYSCTPRRSCLRIIRCCASMCLVSRTQRRPRSCWTCKSRKIGCDRASPACNNCLRTGRNCEGYDFRLVWPDQHDGRRKPSTQGPCPPALAIRDKAIYASQFLNITYADILAHRRPAQNQQGPFTYMSIKDRPCPELPLFIDYHERESHLLKYCTSLNTINFQPILCFE